MLPVILFGNSGKLFHFFYVILRIHDTDIASVIFIRRTARDLFHFTITAKIPAEGAEKFFRQFLFDESQNSVQFHTVYRSAERAFVGRGVHNQQLIPDTALRNAALVVGGFYRVYFAKKGKGQFSRLCTLCFALFKECKYAHICSIPYFHPIVKERRPKNYERIL